MLYINNPSYPDFITVIQTCICMIKISIATDVTVTDYSSNRQYEHSFTSLNISRIHYFLCYFSFHFF